MVKCTHFVYFKRVKQNEGIFNYLSLPSNLLAEPKAPFIPMDENSHKKETILLAVAVPNFSEFLAQLVYRPYIV